MRTPGNHRAQYYPYPYNPPAPNKGLRLDGLSGAYLDLIWGGACMAEGSIGLYEEMHLHPRTLIGDSADLQKCWLSFSRSKPVMRPRARPVAPVTYRLVVLTP